MSSEDQSFAVIYAVKAEILFSASPGSGARSAEFLGEAVDDFFDVLGFVAGGDEEAVF